MFGAGEQMTEPSYPSGAHDYANDAEERRALESAMDGTPRGALVVSGIAVGLLMLGWLFVYFVIFLPRGMVG